MPRKAVAAILIVVLAAGAAVYFFVWKDAGKEGEPALYHYAIKNAFVTNVKESSKLFKATVVLVVNEKGLDKLLDAEQYVIRDTILFILRGLTEEDIKSESVQDRLRVSIPQSLNDALQIENVVSVYFGDFVMQ